MENVFQFNHDAEDMRKALSISEETDRKIQEIVFYSSACNYLLGIELFQDKDDRPKCLTTITGDLEKAMTYVDNQQELSYLLFRFIQIHDLTQDSIGRYKALLSAKKKSERVKAAMLIQLLNMKLEEEIKKREEDEDITDRFISPVGILNRIRLVKESRYNFEKYLDLVEQNRSNLNEFNPDLFYESKTTV